VPGSEPNMPIAGAPSDGGEREVVTKSEDGTSPASPLPTLSLGETPQAASTSTPLIPPGKDAGARKRSPRRAALAIAGSAAAILSVAVVPLVALKGSASTAAPAVSAASVAASMAELEIVVDSGAAESATATAAPAPTPPKTWRVKDMADGDVSVVDVAVGRKGLLASLASVQIPPAEALRVSRSLASVRSIDRLQPQDALTLAFDKSVNRVVAYELKSSSSDVWQAREQTDADGAPALQARKLDLLVSKVRVGKSVLVGSDLRTSLSESGITPVDEVLALLDDALEAHVELSEVRPGLVCGSSARRSRSKARSCDGFLSTRSNTFPQVRTRPPSASTPLPPAKRTPSIDTAIGTTPRAGSLFEAACECPSFSRESRRASTPAACIPFCTSSCRTTAWISRRRWEPPCTRLRRAR
jgi:hypothetical protein